ncbi:MAG TPA: hypothetical protein VFH45_07425 [Acidimicrobiales bacterium]|nr:hypothetical protein [Acidimicrobiales bacterium]
MHWCEDCRLQWEEDQLGEQGSCPKCGLILTDRRRTPWSFKVLAGGTAVYLVYRLVQGIIWLVHHL